MPDTNHDHVLSILSSYVRLLSRSQFTRLWGTTDRQTDRRLRSLSEAGIIQRLGGLMVSSSEIRSPFMVWKSGTLNANPNFDQLAYQLKHRRYRKRIHQSLWIANHQTVWSSSLNQQSGISRRTDWEHDLGVADVWLTVREEFTNHGGRWLLEDHFSDELPNDICKPDALLQWPNGTTELIEYGGCYSADTLRDKFESWYEFDWRLY